MQPASPRRNRRPFRIAAAALALAVGLVASELAVRVYMLAHPARLRVDDRLGWRTVESFAWTGVVTDAAGRSRTIAYTTDRHGFRAFGDRGAAARRRARPRILVLGDSFTQAAAASDSETYYALLGERLGAEVFAYGAGGYGTLQELMILEEVFDEVRPDLVLWQFCTNDFINNDPVLEAASRWDNNGMRRPYLAEDGDVRYLVPKPLAPLRALGESSRLALATFVLWDRLGARWGHTVEQEIAADPERHAGLARSLATTEKLLRDVRRRCRRVPVLVFCADGREPYHAAVARIAERAGLAFVDGVPRALAAASRRGEVVLAADRAHWNDVGHRVCADALEEPLREALAPTSRRRRPPPP